MDKLAAPFTDVSIGGIYPFLIHPFLIYESGYGLPYPNPCPFLKTDSEVIRYAKDLRKLKYEPELKWREPGTVYHYDCRLRIEIDKSIELQDVQLTALVFLYPTGVASLIFWINLEDHCLAWKNLCRLAKFVATPVDGVNATLLWHQGDRHIVTMADFGSLIREQFPRLGLADQDRVEFVHPIVYIGDVRDCSNADEIKKTYPVHITVIANLWEEDIDFVKETEIDKVLQTDFHPYTYGVSCTSSNCTIELHPRKQTEQRARIGGIGLDRHNFREQMLLAYIVELVVIQYFWLRMQNYQLEKVYEEVGVSTWQTLSFNLAQILPLQLLRLAAVHRNAAKIFNDFRSIYLKRQSYVESAISTYRRQFGMVDLESSIERQLASLSTYISTAHRMLLSTIGIVISIIGVVFAVLRIIAYIKT